MLVSVMINMSSQSAQTQKLYNELRFNLDLFKNKTTYFVSGCFVAGSSWSCKNWMKSWVNPKKCGRLTWTTVHKGNNGFQLRKKTRIKTLQLTPFILWNSKHIKTNESHNSYFCMIIAVSCTAWGNGQSIINMTHRLIQSDILDQIHSDNGRTRSRNFYTEL